MYLPLNYEKINMAAGHTLPSSVKAYNNATFAFWERSLFQRACSVMKFTVPDDWEGKVKDFFLYCLFRFGYVAVFDSNEYGLSFQPCTLSGYNFYYQPTRVLIANPVYKADLEIGTDCELLKLTPDYMGIWDIITYYSEKLSCLDISINTGLINSKFGLMLGARTKAAANALKKMLDKINQGEPAVIFDSGLVKDPKNTAPLFETPDIPSVKENYMLHDQLMDFQTLINNFDAEIGIPTVPYQKRERMVESEAESRRIDATSRSVVWLNTLKGSIDEIRKLYPEINLDVELRFPPDITESEVDFNEYS